MIDQAGLPSVILFGSAARGDNDSHSDIDILVIESDTFPQSIKSGKVEIQKLSRSNAMQKCIAGDLFMLHILHEGVAISDPEGFVSRLRESFHLRRDYSAERREALILASFITENWGSFKDTSLLNKRIAWCVRTAVISRLVEEGRIVFSPSGLIKLTPEMNISGLLELRRSSAPPENYISSLKKFVCLCGGGDYLSLSKREYVELINELGKSVALSTLHKMLSDAENFCY